MAGGAAPKRRGSAWERDVAAYLRDNGFPHAERAFGAGRPLDVGDIDGLPGIVVECKAAKTFDLAGWCDEARREQANARAQFGVVVAKRRQRPVGDAYAILTLEQFARLLFEREALQ